VVCSRPGVAWRAVLRPTAVGGCQPCGGPSPALIGSPGRAIRRVTVAGRRHERSPAAGRPPGWVPSTMTSRSTSPRASHRRSSLGGGRSSGRRARAREACRPGGERELVVQHVPAHLPSGNRMTSTPRNFTRRMVVSIPRNWPPVNVPMDCHWPTAVIRRARGPLRWRRERSGRACRLVRRWRPAVEA
jgi:hypothetical protein